MERESAKATLPTPPAAATAASQRQQKQQKQRQKQRRRMDCILRIDGGGGGGSNGGAASPYLVAVEFLPSGSSSSSAEEGSVVVVEEEEEEKENEEDEEASKATAASLPPTEDSLSSFQSARGESAGDSDFACAGDGELGSASAASGSRGFRYPLPEDLAITGGGAATAPSKGRQQAAANAPAGRALKKFRLTNFTGVVVVRRMDGSPPTPSSPAGEGVEEAAAVVVEEEAVDEGLAASDSIAGGDEEERQSDSVAIQEPGSEEEKEKGDDDGKPAGGSSDEDGAGDASSGVYDDYEDAQQEQTTPPSSSQIGLDGAGDGGGGAGADPNNGDFEGESESDVGGVDDGLEADDDEPEGNALPEPPSTPKEVSFVSNGEATETFLIPAVSEGVASEFNDSCDSTAELNPDDNDDDDDDDDNQKDSDDGISVASSSLLSQASSSFQQQPDGILKSQQKYSASDAGSEKSLRRSRKKGKGILTAFRRPPSPSPKSSDNDSRTGSAMYADGDVEGEGGEEESTDHSGISRSPGRHRGVTRKLGATLKSTGVALSSMPQALTSGFGRRDWRTPSLSRSEDGDSEEKPEASSALSKGRSGKWGLLVNLAAVSRTIPRRVRAAREERLQAQAAACQQIDAATRLHELCEKNNVQLEELQAELVLDPGAAAVRDGLGRLPLHILGDNDSLMDDSLGRATAKAFTWQLMKAYPEGVTTLDSFGMMPFVSIIKDWESWVYQHQQSKSGSKSEGASTASGLIAGVAGFVADRASGISTSMNQAASEVKSECSSPRTESASNSAGSGKLFPRVEMWEEVEFCFQMLSYVLDELGKGLYKVHKRSLDQTNQRDNEARNALATHVAVAMPTILKTVLLIEEEGGEMRRRLLKTSIVRRLLLCPESVGSWITSMLRTNSLPSRRAIDYLILASETTVHDYAGEFRTILPEDTEAFENAKELVFEALDGLQGTVASLVVLDMKETERAASTSILWYIMNKNLARPFVLALVLIDLVLHITLLLAFRSDVSVKQGKFALENDFVVPTQTVYFIVAHYIIRKVCEALAVLKISFSVFKGYIFNIWTLFDTAAIITTLVAMSWNDANPGKYLPGLNAFVIGLLWIKVLGFLKVINKEMSTFILALIQILWDLRFFAIVLVIVIFMFADMMRIAITNKDDGNYCNMQRDAMEDQELEGPIGDFCSPYIYQSYVRVYAVLLGDFEIDNWEETDGMLILFALFTLIGVIILLNVLIAVVSDSYDRAKIGSSRLFGRARALFVAQNQALESFLQPGSNPVDALKLVKSPGAALVMGVKILRWAVLVSLIVTAMSAEVFLAAKSIEYTQERRGFINVIIMIFLFVVLTSALWVLLIFAFGNVLRSCLPQCGRRGFDCIYRYTIACVKHSASALFGLRNDVQTKSALSDDPDNDDEEWSCRIVYMERQFEKLVERATADMKDEIKALEKRIYDHEELRRQTERENDPTE